MMYVTPVVLVSFCLNIPKFMETKSTQVGHSTDLPQINCIWFCRLDLLSEGRIGLNQRKKPLVDNIVQQLLTGKVVVDLVRGVA